MALKIKEKEVRCVELFKALDEKATIKRVDKFLTKDMDRLILMSSTSRTELKSPTLSLTSAHTNNGNYFENALVEGIDAQVTILAVHDALNSLPATSKNILTSLYLDNETAWQVAQDSGYSNSRFFELKNKALFEFADTFTFKQFNANCNPIIDLHVYL